MKTSTYMTRALQSKDRRYAVALGKLGYVEPADVGKTDPLDHDGDGRKGGSRSVEQTDEVTALRAKYQEVSGKRAYHGWDADALKAKIAEACGEN